MTCSVPIRKEVKRFGKNGEKATRSLSYKLKFINNARFIAKPLSNLGNNLAEKTNKIKWKCRYDNKK